MTQFALRWPAALMLAMALAFASTTVAKADGEAGLVVDFGGEIVTYCVPFQGDAITGSQMMAAVGLATNQFNGLVCSIDGTGCTHSGSFESCTCECKPGSGSCTSWSLFYQRYGGSWVYSASGFQLLRSRDGEMQAWRWGAGSVSSAAPPASYSFEQVCGHSPRAGIEPTATSIPPTATQPPPTAPPATSAPSTNTTAPATSAPQTPLVTITAAASAAAEATASETGSPAATAATSETAAPDTPAASPSVSGSMTAPPASPSAVSTRAAAAGSEDDSSDGDGGGATNLIAFAAIAGLLVAAIGAAVLRGKRS